jgi:DNA-directed RNA polymerase sigma subunit (sigma70/sigma32)
MKQSIVKWLFELNAKQREVLARRFGLLGYEAATLEDVGREIGLTRERVRQIQVKVCAACGNPGARAEYRSAIPRISNFLSKRPDRPIGPFSCMLRLPGLM